MNSQGKAEFRHILSGHDTIECAYYLSPDVKCLIDYERLAMEKEIMQQSKSRKPTPIQLGCEEFTLAGHGTKSGYPFLIENETFSIQFGEFNQPSFFVTFRSFALWHFGAQRLHERFLEWAESVGMNTFKSERLSRVDFAFDYHFPDIDFDEDNFVTKFAKDNQHRKYGKVQTFRLGEGDLVLRIYNKSDEIQERSIKTWFYDLWDGIEQDMWRIEWQARKKWLRQVGTRTFEDLKERQGDLLRLLVNDHTKLCIKVPDQNRSRWPLHPLWLDLRERIVQMDGLGVARELDFAGLLDERQIGLAISVYGYMKRLAAIQCLLGELSIVSLDDTKKRLGIMLDQLHDRMTWQSDVERRVNEMRLGEW